MTLDTTQTVLFQLVESSYLKFRHAQILVTNIEFCQKTGDMVNSDRHEEISDRQTEKVNTMIFMSLDLTWILPFQMQVRFPPSLHIVNTHPIIFKHLFFHPLTNFQTKSPLILSCHFKDFFFLSFDFFVQSSFMSYRFFLSPFLCQIH